MKKIILSIASIVFATGTIFAQDVIYTVSGELNQSKTALDSILVENLTNDTRILFGNLPAHDSYQINLTKNAYWGTVGVNTFENAPAFEVAQNSPGLLSLNYKNSTPTDMRLTVFNMNGQTVYKSEKKMLNARNSLNVRLGTTGVFLVRIDVPFGSQTFKAIGSAYVKQHDIEVSANLKPENVLKSGLNTIDADFSFTPGDSIRISVYKEGYFSSPAEFKIYDSGFVNFLLNRIFKSFTDSRDNKTYKSVKIGNQEWMAENLGYLPIVNPSSLESYTDPHYYVYGYDGTSVNAAKETENYGTYGVLYNWPAAMNGAVSTDANPSGVQGICPGGWHLPSDEEWKQMEMAIGMSQSEADVTGYRGTNEGTKLKAKSGWFNDNGTDDFGFSGLPGGYRNDAGDFDRIASYGHWWSSTERSTGYAWSRILFTNRRDVDRGYYFEERGYSVRCVRN